METEDKIHHNQEQDDHMWWMSILPKFSINSMLLQPKETEKLVLNDKWKSNSLIIYDFE